MVMDDDTHRDQVKHLEEIELRMDGILLAQAIECSDGLISLDELFADYEENTGNKLD